MSYYDCIIDCLPIDGVNQLSTCNHIPFKSGDYLHYKLKTTHQGNQETFPTLEEIQVEIN